MADVSAGRSTPDAPAGESGHRHQIKVTDTVVYFYDIDVEGPNNYDARITARAEALHEHMHGERPPAVSSETVTKHTAVTATSCGPNP